MRKQQNLYCLTDESVESRGGQRGSIRVKLATVNFALVARHQHNGSLQAGGAWRTLWRVPQQSHSACLSHEVVYINLHIKHEAYNDESTVLAAQIENGRC